MFDRFKRFRETPGAIEWVKEFWDAKRSYEYHERRSVLGIGESTRRMRRAVDELIKLGLFPEGKHERMPTVDEAEGRYLSYEDDLHPVPVRR